MKRSTRPAAATRHGTDGGFSQGLFTVLLLSTLAVAGIAWVGLGIVAKERWPIRWLEINGSFQRVSAEQVRVGLAPLANASFFTVDLQAIKQVAERNAWVAQVSVSKQWPDTVVVTVVEYTPVAHWNSGWMIAPDGQVFTAPDADEIQGLPWLAGPGERLQEVLDQWVHFDGLLDTAALEIDQLKLDQRGSWSMLLSSGTDLRLGRDDAVGRLQRLMASWGELSSTHPLPPLLIDLRYSNGFAVHWPPEAAGLAVNGH